jgi:metallo-beta-lactamase class B
MKRYILLAISAILALVGAVEGQSRTHMDIARAAAYRPGQDFTWIYDRLCFEPAPEPAAAPATPRTGPPSRSVWYDEPAKVFDNLYYFVAKTESVAGGVAAYAITTSQGIIMYDTGFDYSVEESIDKGMRKFGLDPANIKYIVVSPGHTDHSGGARYLQDKYGAHVILSEVDWGLIEKDRTPANLKPKKDMVATDGQKLTLGDTTVTMYFTPGHTPGTISMLIPLKDGNRRHLGTIWGGNNFGCQYFKDRAEAFRTYRDAAKRYMDIVSKAGADVFVSSHIAQDKIYNKITALRFRGPNDPHPFVSKEAVLNHLTVVGECAASRLAGEKAPSD